MDLLEFEIANTSKAAMVSKIMLFYERVLRLVDWYSIGIQSNLHNSCNSFILQIL